MEKICWQITVAAFMQPLQYDLRSPAAKDNSITHAATAWSNLHAAITMRSAETELQNTMELRATASEIVAPKPDGSRRQSGKKTILKHFLKGFLEGKSLAPKWRKKRISCETSFKTPSATHPPAPLAIPFTLRERSYSCKSQWNSVDRTCTKNTWNPIYNAEPIREWSDHDPTTHETVSHPSHRRGRSSAFGDGLCMEKHRVSCICYLSKTHFVRDFLQNSIGNSSTSTTCNPVYIAGTILQLQITMEFCRPHMHEKHLKPHLQCGTDPRMIRPHTRPSRTRRTAEVDHRRSGTDFVWKNTGFRASAISQKRISCETSFKTPSATHPPAPLAIPFTLRERSYSCKSQWNSVDRTCTKNTWNPIYNAEPIREWSDHDPTTHETVSHPSHRRGRSSAFGDGLCMEKHRVSCICYLSKTHFVRDFLQNSIGNSSTSTTCNPIYIAGTISLTNSFPNELFLCSFFD